MPSSSWKDKAGRASFRGVSFYVQTTDFAGGRRTVRHEFPLRDAPYSEDLGLKGREFSVEGHVIGDDYLDQRDALIGALEQAGPGELRHPYYGTRRVSVTTFRVRESDQDGGLASFSITFDETEAVPRFPSASPAASSRIESDTTAVLDAAETLASQSTFSTVLSGVQGYLGLAASKVSDLASVVSDYAAELRAELAPLMETAEDLAVLERSVVSLAAAASSVVQVPVKFLNQVVDLFDSLSIPAVAGIDALLAVFNSTPALARPSSTTASGEQAQRAFDLLLWVGRVALVAEAAKLAASAAFDNYDAAVASRDGVADALDVIADSADDDTFQAIAQLRADLVRAVPGEDSDLPRIARYTPPVTVPSLVLAHRLYGDLSREADLATRNSINRPGFITGGVELEVLSDA